MDSAQLEIESSKLGAEKSLEGTFVEKLTLTDFRNHEFLNLDLGSKSIIITGENGRGKTNILEAISLLSPGRGLRGAKLGDISRKIEDENPRNWTVFSKINSKMGRTEIGTSLDPTSEKSNKRIIKINDQLVKSQTELAEIFNVIWLTPQMDQIFIGTASNRRKFLARLVFNFFPDHASHIVAYEYAMRERARLLKDRQFNDDWLYSLEYKMAENGAKIAYQRQLALSYMQGEIDNWHSPFPKANLDVEGTLEERLKNSSEEEVCEFFKAELKNLRNYDAASGRTNVGVHLSDLQVYHASHKMEASNCSTGEQKALLTAIILAESRAKITKDKIVPVILLDEAVAHLDEVRRIALFEDIQDMGAQCFFTGTDIDLFSSIKTLAQQIKL